MKFSDIPAHESAKQHLRNLVDDDKIPHAILIEGPQGIGKFAMARALAQYIHCTNRQNGDSCGKCPSCIQHQTFNHIDTHYSFPVVKRKSGSSAISDDYIAEWKEFVDSDPYMDFGNWLSQLGNPATLPTFYVNESDSLISKLSFTAHSSKYKIVLMWLPERMMEQCANKLLKLVEEPFHDSIFIMTSNTPDEILPTIYSRCQRIGLRRLPDKEIAEYLERKLAVNFNNAIAIAHIAEGSISKAVNLLDISEESSQYFNWFVSLMRLSYQRKIVELRKWAFDIASLGRERQIAFLTYCCRMLRENFIYNLQNPQLNYLTTDESIFSRNFARFVNERNVIKLNRVFQNAVTDISGNTNSKIVLFDVAVRVILLLKS